MPASAGLIDIEEALDVDRRAPDDRVDPVRRDVTGLGQRDVATGRVGLLAEQLGRGTQATATARRDADADAVGRCVGAQELEDACFSGEAGCVCGGEGHDVNVGRPDHRLETMR